MPDVYSDLEKCDKLGKTVSVTNMPKSMFRLLNWAAEEDKDFPDVDPKKINFEEVTDYLINKNIKVPALGFNTNAFPAKIKDELYPELKVVDKSTQAEDVSGVNFLVGNDKGGQTANAIVNYQPPANTMNTTPAYQGLVDPRYLQTQNVQNLQPVNANQFKALFPNDPLSQAIVERGQQ